MKKIILISALLFTALFAKAQYFQHLYGTTDNEAYVKGVNTFIQPQGHLMAASGDKLVVTYTDVNGSVSSSPNFNKDYQIISNITGTTMPTSSVNVFELEDGSGFGVVGLCFDPSVSSAVRSIFYLHIDPTGVPGTVYEYIPVPGSVALYNLISVNAVAKSPGTDDLYIAGATESSSNDNFIYALKINSVNGNIVWSAFYDVVQTGINQKEYIGGIIESPYQPAGVQELVLVGGGYDMAGNSQDAFFMRVDANNGAPLGPWAFFYGTAATEDVFTSISIANSNIGGTNGFVVGGYSNHNGSYDFWMLKLDTRGGVIWSRLYDYSVSPGNNDICYGVIERFNTSNNYEYYAVGHTSSPTVFNTYDILVIKTDDWGNGVAGGEFTYGIASVNEFGWGIDQYDGTGADGLSVFGISELGGIGMSDVYLIKAYFNGLSGCNESFSTPKTKRGPGLYAETWVDAFDNFSPSSLSSSEQSASDVNLCYNTTIGGGSNARTAPSDPGTSATVVPNPMTQGAATATVELEAETPATVQVTIYDMLGKQYYAGNFALVKGSNRLPVDISSASMAAGMYTVKITGDNINKNVLLVVK
ncbi:MAG TPA: T9SS type A sorting domain-containing protein [Bacteroidia bacterium]|nr:T9SS type A sorting domain-containing protein [Bacteroidia bacterium]